jgi:hypothetical protein
MNTLAPPPRDARLQQSDSLPALEELVILGQPSLQEHLDFIRDNVIGGERADLRAACDEWRRVNDIYAELEKREAGIADKAECRDLDPALEPLAAEVRADAHFRRTFDILPTRIAMVQLDRLVIYQTQVTRQFVEDIKSRLSPRPDAADVFRLCLPVGHRQVPLEMRRSGSRRYTFASESTDLRFHESVLLQAPQVIGHEAYGPVGGVVALFVGFGSNMLNVVRADNRMVLHNGYHRACALRALGVKYAPAIVQTVTRRAELALAATEKVSEDATFYFKSARPPLLKDFFDPRLVRVMLVRRMKKVVEVSFETRVFDVAD